MAERKTSSIKAFGTDIPYKNRRSIKSRSTAEVVPKKVKTTDCRLPKGLYKNKEGKLESCYASSCHDTYSINPEMPIKEIQTELEPISEQIESKVTTYDNLR